MNNINIKEALANADVLYQSGNIEGAFELYQLVTQVSPKTTEAWYNLGLLSTNLQRFDLAENFFLEALKWNKRNADYFNALGETQRQLEKFPEAKINFEKALKRQPSSIRALNNLGQLHLQLEEFTTAEKHFKNALRIAPGQPQLLLNLSSVYLDTEQFDKAEKLLDKAIKLAPDDIMLQYNLARVSYGKRRFGEAVMRCTSALEHCDNAYLGSLLHILLANAYKSQARFELAEESYQHAIKLNPNQAEPHIALGLIRIINGKLQEGWPELAWVIHKNRYLSRFKAPIWSGEDLTGKRLTYIAEQGLGDEILFANMFPELLSRADHCTIECDKRLIPLFSRSFPGADFIPRLKPPAKELVEAESHHFTWGSQSAGLLRHDIGQFPSRSGYLRASDQRVRFWKQKLDSMNDRLKVGICWRSMVSSLERRGYSSIVDDWDALLCNQKFTFINLQYDNCDEELAAVREKLGITIFNPDIDLMNDLDEVAALMSALDMVVSSHTAVSALSGSLGIETCVLTPRFNWTMLGTERFPWYPNSRAAVLHAGQKWSDVITGLSQELDERYS